ncbi:MAG: peptidoglycan DD-metalloendopeptidase family protein [Anaerolineae bacterium]|nr:peptidoglycan DD-metalloendopeptidase family protein [Anaerolineae bacterium]
MANPYDGKVYLWHWEGDAVGEATVNDVVNTLKNYGSVVDGLFIKTSNGTEWQGKYDSKTALAINSASDVAKWVNAFASHNLEIHIWCVVLGKKIDGEIEKVVKAAQVPGVKSVILDIEPYDGFWEGSSSDVVRLMTGIRSALGSGFHIGISVDPRQRWYSTIHPDAWRPYVDSVHPMCYWGEMVRTPEDVLTEAYVVWGPYGLPIYPVLQAYGVSSDSIREAQDIARSVRGASGLSYWRFGSIGPVEFAAINDEFVDEEIGPDKVWRRYDWEKIIAPYDSGYMDGTHINQPSTQVFSELTSVRGHPIKYKKTRADRDTVWAIWRPNLPAAGTYEVSVFVPGTHATSTQARYHIHGISGVGTELLVKLNKSRYSDQWVPLVVYQFEDSADGAQVNLTDLTGESGKEIAFSAVRWRRVIEQAKPNERGGFDAPVGTAEERMSDKLWPGTWFDAVGFGTYYGDTIKSYHTGADLNNNKPVWDTDANAPVYSPADGTVTFSAVLAGTWGHVIVIRYDPLPDGTVVWSRMAHVNNPLVREGDRVERGQQIGSVGDAFGQLAYHLHYDIAKTDILEQQPWHWPGLNLDAVYQHYTDPKAFTEAHRPKRS